MLSPVFATRNGLSGFNYMVEVVGHEFGHGGHNSDNPSLSLSEGEKYKKENTPYMERLMEQIAFEISDEIAKQIRNMNSCATFQPAVQDKLRVKKGNDGEKSK